MTGLDEQFYDFGLANDTIARLQYAKTKTPTLFFSQSGFARPHAPWRVPQRFWDMYEDVFDAAGQVPCNDRRDGWHGVAWHQQGFFSAENSTVWVPLLDQPIPDQVQRAVRRA